MGTKSLYGGFCAQFFVRFLTEISKNKTMEGGALGAHIDIGIGMRT